MKLIINAYMLTIQLLVFDNLLESAWMQYPTSARGDDIDTAANISAKIGTFKIIKIKNCNNYPRIIIIII